MVGADGSWTAGLCELNVQYIHREDTNPLFAASAVRVKSDMGLAEILIRPDGSRWHGFALYNLVTADRPLLDVGLGGPSDIRRYESATAGLGYQVRRNLRATGEMMWDFQRERMRWIAGFVTAF
jgi:hypothetical protein